MDAHDLVLNFCAFLVGGYATWARTAELAAQQDGGSLEEAFDDWAQANWELLVERPLCPVGEFLEVYGGGTDYEARGDSRVFFHDAEPTHRIQCAAVSEVGVIDLLTGEVVDPAAWDFECLVARAGDWYEVAPPFDHVLLKHKAAIALVPLGAVRFERVGLLKATPPATGTRVDRHGG